MKDMVPAEPIRRLVETWAAKHPDVRELIGNRAAGCCLGNTGVIAHLTGVPADYIKNIRNGRTLNLSFDLADRIVTRLSEFGGMGWHQDPELKALYQGFDFAALDRDVPTTRSAA